MSTGPLASHSSASAAAASSRLSASSASAAASRSTAYRNTPSTPSPSSRSSASNSDDVAASSGQTSTERLFGSIGRSPVSITLTALISAAILAILLGITAFFLRRCYRRRRRVAHRSLGSEGGSPRDGAWGEKDLEEKFEPQVDSDEDEGIDDEAVWRRRVNRLNAMNASRPYAAPVVARSKPQVSVAPEMSPISERMTSSDWTSFVGDGEFGDSTNGSSRKGSVDSQDEAAFIETFSSKGLTADMHPHPLRHSWIPSDDSDSDHSFDEASSRYSPDEESLIAGLPPTPRSRNFSTSPPVSPGQLQPTPRSPSKSGDLQLSLDRLVGSAAEYFGAFFSDDGHSSADHSKTQEDGEAADRFTSFKKPRKAPPTPIIIPPTPRFTSSSPPPVSAPTFPVRAATYTASATEEPSRPVTSRGSNLSFLERSYSDGAAFLGVAHAHVARSVRGKLALAAGREKGLAAGATSWEGVRDSAAVREESEQDSLPQDEAQAQAPAQADNPFDDSNAVASPTVPYNPPSLGRQTPPPTVGLPLLPYLSPFGTSRAANATPVTAEDDKDSNYWSDETTSTVKNYSRPLSMGSTIRPTPRTTTQRQSMLARRVSIASSSSCSSSSSEDEPRPLQRTFSSPELAAAASRRPRPVSTASTGTFGSRESEWEESSSAESVESDSSRAKRERVTRALMSERRRRSEGEVIKRVSGAELSA